MKPRRAAFWGFVTALLLVALPAIGHVTVRADNPEAGGFAVYTIRVPNESDTAATTRIEVEIPAGLEASRYQPKPGWTMSIADGVLTIEGGPIRPGEFEEFHFQARNPEQAGSLAFAALQTYDDGEVVNWTGGADSDTPASVVEIGAAAPEGEDGNAASDNGPVTIVALALGGLGFVMGAVALFRPRRV